VSNVRTIAPVRVYFVTPYGHDAIEQLPTCGCKAMVFDGGLLTCPDCGTIYARGSQVHAGGSADLKGYRS
jgi:hypothetical protein